MRKTKQQIREDVAKSRGFSSFQSMIDAGYRNIEFAIDQMMDEYRTNGDWEPEEKLKNFAILVPAKLTDIPADSGLFYHGEESIPRPGKGEWSISAHKISKAAFNNAKSSENETDI